MGGRAIHHSAASPLNEITEVTDAPPGGGDCCMCCCPLQAVWVGGVPLLADVGGGRNRHPTHMRIITDTPEETANTIRNAKQNAPQQASMDSQGWEQTPLVGGLL